MWKWHRRWPDNMCNIQPLIITIIHIHQNHLHQYTYSFSRKSNFACFIWMLIIKLLLTKVWVYFQLTSFYKCSEFTCALQGLFALSSYAVIYCNDFCNISNLWLLGRRIIFTFNLDISSFSSVICFPLLSSFTWGRNIQNRLYSMLTM